LRFIRRVEENAPETGKVRALILKGRQLGISTYVGGRFFHLCTHERGAYVYILLMSRTRPIRCSAWSNASMSIYRSREAIDGQGERQGTYFDRLDSGYAVGTAGTKATGRSKTNPVPARLRSGVLAQRVEPFCGVVQTVPDLPGTEIILSRPQRKWETNFINAGSRQRRASATTSQCLCLVLHEDYTRAVPPAFALMTRNPKYQGLARP